MSFKEKTMEALEICYNPGVLDMKSLYLWGTKFHVREENIFLTKFLHCSWNFDH